MNTREVLVATNSLLVDLTDEEAVMLQALGHFGSALTALDHDPKSLAKVALIFSATGFAAYGCFEDFAEEIQQLY